MLLSEVDEVKPLAAVQPELEVETCTRYSGLFPTSFQSSNTGVDTLVCPLEGEIGVGIAPVHEVVKFLQASN